jgi:iron complex outermembrane receptor protein
MARATDMTRAFKYWITVLLASCATFASGMSRADSVPDLVIVTATRSPANAKDLPASADRINQQQIRAGNLQVNLSETLNSIAGVSAQNRQNYAQDLQLSIRGYGARASFGVRGMRLYSDGIPATMPDGQGQLSQFDLGSADHIEVLRGPFSALYGNSSGGVIALFTEDAPANGQVDANVAYGSFGARRFALMAMGRPGGANVVVNVARFHTDGYREHSAATRDSLNLRSRWQPDELTRITLVANAVNLPEAQDPVGLTRAQLEADAGQAGNNALALNARKSVEQEQLGGTLERTLNAANHLTLMVYAGQRHTRQFQAIPQASQSSPTHPGGVIDLDRNYRGFDLHLVNHCVCLQGSLEFTAGLNYDAVDEARRGYLNFLSTSLGVQGDLRRSEANRVYDFDQYLQAKYDAGRRWLALAGIRNSVVDVRSTNLLLPASSPASGLRFTALNPVAGATYRATRLLNAYAAYGRGFETPTLNELAYRSTDGSLPGLNLALQPARSDNYEVGLKATADRWRSTLALFQILTTNELAVQANAAGRSAYENIPETRRRGLELETQGSWGARFSAQLAYTYLDAVTARPYTSCAGLPCGSIPIAAGQRLPAIPADSLYVALTWRLAPKAPSITVEGIHRARIYVNDRNSDAAAGYTLANVHLDLRQKWGRWHADEALRIDNLFDARYVGSVIVNESNAKYFEPEPDRSIFLMFTLSLRS